MPHDLHDPPLPDHLRRYFQEYDTERFSRERSRHTILRRLLEEGGWDAVRWLLDEVGPEEIREFILRRGGRGMEPRRLRFWALILDLPEARVDHWIAAWKANPWHGRTGR